MKPIHIGSAVRLALLGSAERPVVIVETDPGRAHDISIEPHERTCRARHRGAGLPARSSRVSATRALTAVPRRTTSWSMSEIKYAFCCEITRGAAR